MFFLISQQLFLDENSSIKISLRGDNDQLILEIKFGKLSEQTTEVHRAQTDGSLLPILGIVPEQS